MAIKYLNNIDLDQNQLIRAVVHNSTGDPASPLKGQIYMDTTNNVLKFHDGTNFVSVMDNTTIADTIRQIKVDTTNNGTANATLSASEALQLIGGNAVTLAESGGIVTINSTDTNTQNSYVSSFVDSDANVSLRLTKSGAASGTQDLTFVAGDNITLTPSGTNLTIASAQKSDSTIRGLISASGVLSYDNSTGALTSSAQANVATNLSKTTATGQITINSSTGDNVVIGEATGSIAGLMSTTHHNKLDGITASADVNRTAAETRTLIGTGNGNLVPAAPSSPTTKFLRGDGSFQTPAYITNTTTGAQMTEATLRSKLSSITENVTIGDATDVQVTIAGNLVVSGTTTTVNSTTVNLNDHNIVLDSGNSTSAVVDGAGITLEGGSGDNATFTYRASTAVKAFELKLGEAYESLKVDNLEAASLTVTDYALAASDIPNLAASKITSGSFATARIPSLAASKITSGSFDAARIPSLNTSKLTAGTLGAARGGTGITNFANSTHLNSNTTASDVSLGNVTNESKSTMFASPTFTGTVAGVTKSHVGLGSVTNESKSTMFTDAALTGDPTAPTQTAGDSSTKIATTAFVATATASIGKVTKKISGTGSATSFTMSHNFGTPHVMTQLLDYGNNGTGATYDVVHADIRRNSDNAVDVVFGSAPLSTEDYLVLITKMPAIS